MKSINALFVLLLSAATAYAQLSPINRAGLKYERVTIIDRAVIKSRTGADSITALTHVAETGRVVGIEVTVAPSPLIATPHVRKVELLSLADEIDMEMTVQARINYYDVTGSQLMTSVIQADTLLSADAKAMKQGVFDSYTLAPKSTRGSFVNPATGALVPMGTAGAIREITFYQNLTKSILINGMGLSLQTENREQFIRYAMIAYMLQSIATRVGI